MTTQEQRKGNDRCETRPHLRDQDTHAGTIDKHHKGRLPRVKKSAEIETNASMTRQEQTNKRKRVRRRDAEKQDYEV